MSKRFRKVILHLKIYIPLTFYILQRKLMNGFFSWRKGTLNSSCKKLLLIVLQFMMMYKSLFVLSELN